MKKLIILILINLSSITLNGWLNLTAVQKAIKEHDEAYEKFAAEKESTNIKVSAAAFKFVYTPETPHLQIYFEAFKKLDDRVNLHSCLKSFLIGLPVGLLFFYALLKDGHIKKPLSISLLSGLLFAIYNVIHENKSYGKHPYFDILLGKHDNYFENASVDTVLRILGSYYWFIMGGFLGAGAGTQIF